MLSKRKRGQKEETKKEFTMKSKKKRKKNENVFARRKSIRVKRGDKGARLLEHDARRTGNNFFRIFSFECGCAIRSSLTLH